ncbi:MAG TPA: endo-1,4-beta-xylanase, partial [Chitinophagaceae bacterium]|nr:endo-1,4-beta-xylanase [Chitinophagaceae bacterium]
MHLSFKIVLPVLIAVSAFAPACRKASYSPAVIDSDSTLSLKSAAQYPLGVGADYDLLVNNSSYAAIVKAQFNSATAGYIMKHGAVVQNNGSYNFGAADNFVNI